MAKDYSNKNAQPVLEKVEQYIARGGSYYIRYVYDDLAIFDWWNEKISQSQLKQMRSFLKLAIELGYTGKVSFRVGASGCSHGMWAHKEVSTDGYDPDSDCIFRSFTPDYTHYSFKKDGRWSEEVLKEQGLAWNSIKTQKQLKEYLQMAYSVI